MPAKVNKAEGISVCQFFGRCPMWNPYDPLSIIRYCSNKMTSRSICCFSIITLLCAQLFAESCILSHAVKNGILKSKDVKR